MATNTLHIRVRSDGTRKVSRGVKRIAENANLASRQIFLMRRAITTLITAAGVRAVFRAAEAFTALNNKLKTVTKTTQELVRVRKSLLAIANETRTSLGSLTQLYTRTTRAVKSLGLSEKTRLKFAKLLSKEAVIGGATTIEAENAIRQLTQGMGAAGLKGEELRSVLEQLPTVAQRIADFLGVATSELRALGAEGKLTGEVVVQAMLAAEGAIESAFGETVSTVGQSFEVFKNNFQEFVGKLDDAVSGTRLLAAAIKLVGENLAVIVTLMTALAARAGIVFLTNSFGSLSKAVVGVTKSVFSFVKALLVVKTVVPVVESATAAFTRMTLAASAARVAGSAAAVPVAAKGGLLAAGGAALLGLSVPVLAAIAAGIAAVTFAIFKMGEASSKAGKKAARMQNQMSEQAADLERQIRIIRETSEEDLFGVVGDDTNRRLGGLGAGNLIFKELDRTVPGVTDLLRELQKLEEFAKRRGGKNVDGLNKSIANLKEQLRKKVPDTYTRSIDDSLDKFENMDKRAAEILSMIRGMAEGDFSKEELAGTKEMQRLEEILRLRTRIAEITKDKLADKSPVKEADRAVATLSEELDELKGGVLGTTDALRIQNELFIKWGGNVKAMEAAAAGASDAHIRAMIKEQDINDDLVKAMADSKRQGQEATRQKTAQTNAINANIAALEKELRLFGLSDRARKLAEFNELGAGTADRETFRTALDDLGRRQTEANAQASVSALRQEIQRFAERSAELKKLAAGAPPKQAAEITALLKKGQAQLDEAARTLAERLATEVGASASTMVEEARTVLVAGGTKIGTAVGTAFSSAFKAALAGAIPGLSALTVPGGGFPVGPGDPTGTGVSTERQEQIDAARAAQQSLLSDITATNDEMKRLIDNTKLFGFTAENSSGRASNALKGFGEEAITLGGELKNAFSSIFGSLEDALVGFVTTGKLDFKSLINSIIADLARMVIRMLIIKPLMGFFGGFFGGAFGFSGGGSVGNAFGLPGLAGGGLVSDDPAVPQRFAIGGRVSGPGTGVSDSVSALLSRDEFVVNAAASRPNMAGLEYLNQTGRMPGNGNVTSVSYSPNVNVTVEGNSANAAGDGAQIAKDMEQQMRAQFNEFVAQEQKPGGAFSKTNEDVL